MPLAKYFVTVSWEEQYRHWIWGVRVVHLFLFVMLSDRTSLEKQCNLLLLWIWNLFSNFSIPTSKRVAKCLKDPCVWVVGWIAEPTWTEEPSGRQYASYADRSIHIDKTILFFFIWVQIPNVTCSGLSVRCLFSVQAKLCQWFGNASATCLRQFLEIDVPVQSTLDPEWAPVKGCEMHRIGKSFLRSFGGTGSPCFYVVSS